MTKKLFFVSVVVMAIIGLLAAGVSAGVHRNDRNVPGSQPIPKTELKPSLENTEPTDGRPSSAQPVGSAASPVVDSRGKLIGQTYQDMDRSYCSVGRTVAVAPAVSSPIKATVHFTWTAREAGTGGHNRWAYSGYDANNGTYPIPSGKVIVQNNTPTSVQGGFHTKLVVDPAGRAIVSGYDYADTATTDTFRIHVAFDAGSIAGSFGTITGGSRMSTAANKGPEGLYTGFPQMELKVTSTDTIFYLASSAGANTLKIYRKVGKSQSPNDDSWQIVYIDSSSNINQSIACDPTSSRVAMSWIREGHGSPSLDSGNDVWYASSDDGITNWQRHNLTNIGADAQFAAFEDQQCLFDHEGKLHIIWTAYYTYEGTDSANWGNRSCRGFHWSEQDQSKIYTYYDAPWRSNRLNVCGAIGSNILNFGRLAFSECDSRLYIAFEANDPTLGPNDDCARVPVATGYAGNGEYYVTVSKDLLGKSWDQPRNLTNSYSPACDTGYCADDTHGSFSKDEMDDANYSGNKNWTNAETYDFGTGYTGSKYLQFFSMTDRYPGWDLGNDAGTWPYTLNDLRWIRMACVPPIVKAVLTVSPTAINYPEYTRPGTSKNYKVYLNASGNSDLTFSSITDVMDSARGVASGATGWMSHTYSNTVIPESEADSMILTLNAGGVVTSGPTVLFGKLRLIYGPPTDTVEIPVRFAVADTVVSTTWDTVNTACTRLSVGTNGNIGGNYVGGANLDYTGNPLECDTGTNGYGDATIYLGDGSPIIVRKVTTPSTKLIGSFSAFSVGDYDQANGFKPVTGTGYAPHGAFTDPGGRYTGFNSGTFLTVDSMVKVECTWWAPTHADSCNFVIQRMRVIPATAGVAVNNLMIGEMIDFDVPSDSGASTTSYSGNTGGYDVTKKLLWQRGFRSNDTSVTNRDCADNSKRYAGLALLGQHLKTGSCSADSAFGGTVTRNSNFIVGGGITVDTLYKIMHVAGFTIDGSAVADQSTFMTFKDGASAGWNLPANDTLTVYTAIASVRSGTLDSLKAAVDKAKTFLSKTIGLCKGGCCVGTRGNVNGSGIVDLSDLSALVSYLTGGGYVLTCVDAANVNGNGIVDLSDLSALVSYLTGGGYVLPSCP